MSEFEEICGDLAELINHANWFGNTGSKGDKSLTEKTKHELENRIRSIITERDALRAAAHENLLCEQMIEDEIAKMNRS